MSRPDLCGVDFGRETPKFWFELCRGFLGGFFPPFFSRKKARKKSTRKSPAKFTQDFARKNSPRISTEAFSWKFDFGTSFKITLPQKLRSIWVSELRISITSASFVGSWDLWFKSTRTWRQNLRQILSWDFTYNYVTSKKDILHCCRICYVIIFFVSVSWTWIPPPLNQPFSWCQSRGNGSESSFSGCPVSPR